MTDALKRHPSMRSDGTENWHDFMSSITKKERRIIELNEKHIRLVQYQTALCNKAVHESNEVATATAIRTLPEGEEKILWAGLYFRAYKKTLGDE